MCTLVFDSAVVLVLGYLFNPQFCNMYQIVVFGRLIFLLAFARYRCRFWFSGAGYRSLYRTEIRQSSTVVFWPKFVIRFNSPYFISFTSMLLNLSASRHKSNITPQQQGISQYVSARLDAIQTLQISNAEPQTYNSERTKKWTTNTIAKPLMPPITKQSKYRRVREDNRNLIAQWPQKLQVCILAY